MKKTIIFICSLITLLTFTACTVSETETSTSPPITEDNDTPSDTTAPADNTNAPDTTGESVSSELSYTFGVLPEGNLTDPAFSGNENIEHEGVAAFQKLVFAENLIDLDAANELFGFEGEPNETETIFTWEWDDGLSISGTTRVTDGGLFTSFEIDTNAFSAPFELFANAKDDIDFDVDLFENLRTNSGIMSGLVDGVGLSNLIEVASGVQPVATYVTGTNNNVYSAGRFIWVNDEFRMSANVSTVDFSVSSLTLMRLD
jgi:hypothetical protein